MKSKWITRGIPLLVVILATAIGMMSCATDPLSSNDNVRDYDNSDSQTYVVQSGNTIPDESTTMEAPVRTSAFGSLKHDPIGGCWFLMEKPKVGFELRMTGEYLRPEDEGRFAMVYGIESWQIKPVCSEFFPVFRVSKIEFKY